jgi:chemotaxis protein MotB
MFFFTMALTASIAIGFSGCTVIFQKGRRADVERISKLKSDLSELERAKQELESRLKNEINDKEVKVEMLAKGLVITFVAEVLFDSGKAQLRKGSFSKLDKVAGVLNTTVADLNVGVEGYTDNEPIRKSGWKSNWELSSARALSVLHYLSQKDVSEPRLAAIGYGEYKPVASNDTKEGRQKNRRVEIVILPKTEKTKSEQ